MSPAKCSRSKASESNKPRKVSGTRKLEALKQRKLPKLLTASGMLYNGVSLDDFYNLSNMTQTAIYPSTASQSNQDSALDFIPVLPSANSLPPKFPVSALTLRYPENETGATTCPPTTTFLQSQYFLQSEDFKNSQMDYILSMGNNPYQSYGYVANCQQTTYVSLGFNDDPFQYPFPDPNDQYSTPHWQSTMPYAPATFLPDLPTVRIDIPSYVESSMGSSELEMMSSVGSDFAFGPFANDDARRNPYFG